MKTRRQVATGGRFDYDYDNRLADNDNEDESQPWDAGDA